MATISLTGEIVVTDNNSTDHTVEIAKNAGAIVIFEPINQISRARNAGVKAASGHYFIKAVLGYWNLISRVFRLAAGCFVYARRDDFESCGGFSEKVYATEEIWFSMALKRKAKKYKRKFRIINKPKAITSGRKLVWFSHSYQVVLLIIIFLFPFVTRFKWVCGYWYKRPQNK